MGTWSKAAAGARSSASHTHHRLLRPILNEISFDSGTDSRKIGNMSAIVKPSLQAFRVCAQVIEDSVTKKKSLIGLFTHLQALTFPFQHQQMGLYFCLTDAEGVYRFDIDLMYLNTEQLV